MARTSADAPAGGTYGIGAMVAMVAQDCMISANVHDDRCRMDHGITEWIEARLPRAKAAMLLTHRQGNGAEKIY